METSVSTVGCCRCCSSLQCSPWSQKVAWYYMRTPVCEFEMHLRWNVLLLQYLLFFGGGRLWLCCVRFNCLFSGFGETKYLGYYIVPGTYVHVCRGVLAVALDADHPTRTPTLTRPLWGDLCLDAVACEGSRLIRPKGDAVDRGCVLQNSRTRVCIQHFRKKCWSPRKIRKTKKKSGGTARCFPP